ncbi:MAG: hypothetical protein SangKO_005760 [Sandaracinaceae bacterium]
MRVASLILVVLAWLPAAVHAQCAEGRVPTGEGYCCWPGQTWNDERSRCVGPPRCPEGSFGEGDECVPRTGATETRAEDQAGADQTSVRGEPRYDGMFGGEAEPVQTGLVTGDVGEGWPRLTTRVPWGALNPRRETSLNPEWLGAGLSMALAGYGAGVLGAVAALTTRERGDSRHLGDTDIRSCRETYAAFALVPLVGPLVAIFLPSSCEIPVYRTAGSARFRTAESTHMVDAANFTLVTGAALVFQLAGLASVVLAFFDRSTAIVFDGEGARVSLTADGIRVTF